MSETTHRNPVVTGWLVAIAGLLVAGGLGYLLMWIGSNRIEAAKQTERPYQIAFSYIAEQAVAEVAKASAAISTNDWGQAQQALDRAGNAVTVMERATTEANKADVAKIRTALGDAQSAVGTQDKAAADRVADLERRLGAFVLQTR